MSASPNDINTKGGGDDESAGGKCVAGLIWVISIILICCTFPFSLCICVRMVQEYERAVIFRLGRVKKGGAVGPGLFFIVPCMDQIIVTDLRTISFDVPPQEILTKDSVTVAVDAVVYYKIVNPMSAFAQCRIMPKVRNCWLVLHSELFWELEI